MTYHNYISLYLFFIFVFYLFHEIESFTPAGRYAHSSVLVENKLYFFGGFTNSGSGSNEVFYLDASQQFNIASPPWNDLTASKGMPIKSYFGTVSLNEANNEQSIYLFGGMTRDLATGQDSFKSLVYKLNLRSSQWEIPITKGKVPERRREIKAISDNSGKTYIFGGNTFSLTPPPSIYFNDMIIFDTVDLSWSINYLPNAPTIRSAYAATLLSNGVIAYIGGYGPVGNAILEVDMSQITLFDTKSLTWSVQTAKLTGQIDGRVIHSAVLAPNGKIIIYGGIKMSVGEGYAQVTPDMAVLNTETTPFEWTIPSVSSNIGAVPLLAGHTANIIGNYMIVAFGNITQPNGLPLALPNANIYIMDVRNYAWVNTFEPEIKQTPSNASIPTSSTNSARPTNTQSDVNNTNVIIGTISGIVGTAVLMVMGIFGYKWYQRYKSEKEDNVMRIHGNI